MFCCCINDPVSSGCRTKIILFTILVIGVLVALMGHAMHKRSTYTLEYCQFSSCSPRGLRSKVEYKCSIFDRHVTVETSKPCDTYSAKLYLIRYSNPVETVNFARAGYLQFLLCFGIASAISYVFLAFHVANQNAISRRDRDIERSDSGSTSMDTMSERSTSSSSSLSSSNNSSPALESSVALSESSLPVHS